MVLLCPFPHISSLPLQSTRIQLKYKLFSLWVV